MIVIGLLSIVNWEAMGAVWATVLTYAVGTLMTFVVLIRYHRRSVKKAAA